MKSQGLPTNISKFSHKIPLLYISFCEGCVLLQKTFKNHTDGDWKFSKIDDIADPLNKTQNYVQTYAYADSKMHIGGDHCWTNGATVNGRLRAVDNQIVLSPTPNAHVS